MNYAPYYTPYMSQNKPVYGSNYYGQPSYAPTMQQMPLQAQNQPQMAQQYDVPIQDIRFVTSEEAKAYIVMPNSTVLLIDKSSGKAILKSADPMGQSASKFFKFEEINVDGSPIKPTEIPQSPNFEDFVKKSDLNGMGFVTTEQYSKLEQKIDSIQKMIGGKSNATQKNSQ